MRNKITNILWNNKNDSIRRVSLFIWLVLFVCLFVCLLLFFPHSISFTRVWGCVCGHRKVCLCQTEPFYFLSYTQKKETNCWKTFLSQSQNGEKKRESNKRTFSVTYYCYFVAADDAFPIVFFFQIQNGNVWRIWWQIIQAKQTYSLTHSLADTQIRINMLLDICAYACVCVCICLYVKGQFVYHFVTHFNGKSSKHSLVSKWNFSNEFYKF